MRVIRTAAACVVAAFAFALLTGVAHAAGGAQDQTSTDTSNIVEGLVSQAHSAVATQTFTAGVSGTLTDVQLPVWNEFGSGNGTLVLAVHPAPGGVVNNGVTLATVSMSEAGITHAPTPTWYDFAFGTPPALVAGSQYALSLSETSIFHQHFWWFGSSSDVYPGGAASDTSGGASGDFAFTTFMLSSAVPGGGRAAYCSVAGDTWVDGTAIPVGTFLNLVAGQPSSDPHYAGATLPFFIEGEGLSCDVPAGYSAGGQTVGYGGLGSAGPFPFYRRPA